MTSYQEGPETTPLTAAPATIQQFFSDATSTLTIDLAAGSAKSAQTGKDALFGIENATGGSGDDILIGDGESNILAGGVGDDTLDGGVGNDVLDGGKGDDTFKVSDGQDIIIAGGGADVLEINSDYTMGDVLLNEQTGDLVFNLTKADGSAHTVTVQNYADSPVSVLRTFSSATDFTDYSLKVDYDSSSDTYSASTDSPTLVIGTAGSETLQGGAKDDRLVGNNGNDILDGGAGDDILDGGAGDDVYRVSDGKDTVITGGNRDTLEITADYELKTIALDKETGNLTFSVIKKQDKSEHSVVVQRGDRDADADAISAVRIFTSDKASNTYDLKVSYDTATNTYSASSETFAGLAGTAKAENLVGGAGVDLIYGNAGDDILVGGAGDDILDGGADEDTVNYSGISSDLTVNLGSATEQASSAQSGVDTLIDIENVVAGSGNDSLTETAEATLWWVAGADRLDGGLGNDVLDGGAGDDVFVVSDGQDTIISGGGTDTLEVSADYTLKNMLVDSATGDLQFVFTDDAQNEHQATVLSQEAAPVTTLKLLKEGAEPLNLACW